ncbi:unnamed protein product [Ectocarpus sp. 12 AP-2014]
MTNYLNPCTYAQRGKMDDMVCRCQLRPRGSSKNIISHHVPTQINALEGGCVCVIFRGHTIRAINVYRYPRPQLLAVHPAYWDRCRIWKQGSVESVFEDRPDGASSMSFKTMVNTAAVGTRSYNPVQFKFTFHIKQPLRQVIIYSKPQWSMPTRQIHTVRQFVTQANHRLNVGTLEVDDSADVSVSFKTAAEFGGINDITPVLTSFMKAHAGIGLDCFRALTAIKDADVDVNYALGMIGMVGPTGEMSTQADDKLSAMLSVLSAPA